MISFAVHFRFAPDKVEEAIETLRVLAEASRREPGCVLYCPNQSKDDPTRFVLFEQYRDQAALDAHRNAPHFQRYAAGKLYQIMEERRVEDYRSLA